MPVFDEKKKVLVVSPHPDDLDFGCGGTIARLAQEGHEVCELIISDGSKGSHKVGFGGAELAQIREQEQKKAAQVLGASPVVFLREVDGEIENTKRLRKKLVAAIRTIAPQIVFTFDPCDLKFENTYLSHRDHRVGGEAVFDAIYPAVGNTSFFPELQEQGLLPHQVEAMWFFASSHPDTFIDIEGTLEKKAQALACHESQIHDLKEIPALVAQFAKTEGEKGSLEYAEAFRVLLC